MKEHIYSLTSLCPFTYIKIPQSLNIPWVSKIFFSINGCWKPNNHKKTSHTKLCICVVKWSPHFLFLDLNGMWKKHKRKKRITSTLALSWWRRIEGVLTLGSKTFVVFWISEKSFLLPFLFVRIILNSMEIWELFCVWAIYQEFYEIVWKLSLTRRVTPFSQKRNVKEENKSIWKEENKIFTIFYLHSKRELKFTYALYIYSVIIIMESSWYFVIFDLILLKLFEKKE